MKLVHTKDAVSKILIEVISSNALRATVKLGPSPNFKSAKIIVNNDGPILLCIRGSFTRSISNDLANTYLFQVGFHTIQFSYAADSIFS